MSSSFDSILSFAVPQLLAVGTIVSSPGCQSAGVAALSLSAFWRASMILLISWKFLPVERGSRVWS